MRGVFPKKKPIMYAAISFMVITDMGMTYQIIPENEAIFSRCPEMHKNNIPM